MPRKVRQVLRDFRKLGFSIKPKAGKGAHRRLVHADPRVPKVTLSGKLNDDAQPWQERDLRDARAAVAAAALRRNDP